MNLSLTSRLRYSPPVEFVERKGVGHPDTLCDRLAEDLSRRLAREYTAHTGAVQHFNVDKAVLAAGSVDVGFGGGGLLHPIPLVEAQVVRHYAWDYHLVREDSGWVLQSLADAQWMDLYTFTLDRQYRIDYEVANYYVSTHPASQFTQGLFVQQATPQARYFLHADTLTIDRGAGRASVQTLTDNDARLAVLAETFDLHFPPGTTFDRFPKPIDTKEEDHAR